MNVFVLCTGRSGSSSFIKACEHISNFTASHESRSQFLGGERFAFHDNHIEADNRLNWQLSQLDNAYGKDGIYIYLKRDKTATAESFMNRFLLPKSMIYAYANAIKKQPPESLSKTDRLNICKDYINTVEENILFFLKDKPQQMTITLENISDDFVVFWNEIRAEGNLDLALKEFDIKHNKRPLKSYNLSYSLKHLWLKLKMLLLG
jgi:hypothetical protein